LSLIKNERSEGGVESKEEGNKGAGGREEEKRKKDTQQGDQPKERQTVIWGKKGEGQIN